MEKRILHFFVITILFLIGYTYLISKLQPQRFPSTTPPSSQHTEVEEVTEIIPPETLGDKLTEEVTEVIPPETLEDKLTVVETDYFIITFSTTGGYIKNVYIKPYKEDLVFHNIGYLPEFKGAPFLLHSPQKNKVVLENKELGVKKIWEFEGYFIKLSLFSPKEDTTMELFSNSLSPNMLDQRYQEIFYKEEPSATMIRIPLRKIKELKKDSVEIVGARDRYFCVASPGLSSPVSIYRKDKDILVNTIVDRKESIFKIYLGPQLDKELIKHNLEDIVYYGFFHGIGILILKILFMFNYLTHSWGTSILLLSIVIYFVLFPFTAKSTKAMKRMQELQPEIESLRSKYKDNPQKLNNEILELYKRNKINPLGGCLPLFFQFPVFIALYQVLLRFVELKGASFLWIKDLSLPDHTFKLPISLPYIGNFLNILPLLILIISYFQQKITGSKMGSQQQSTATMFVFVIGIIFYHFPSCLVLYWLIQNTLTFIYQFRTHRAASLSQ